MVEWQKNLNALVILILTGVLLGAYAVQFFGHEEPCPLCMLQRLGMIGVASSLLLNIRFGIRTSHYALALLSSLMGGTVALRQISLHVCPGFPQFGFPVLGLSLYTWSFIVFACCVLAVAVLLFLYGPKDKPDEEQSINVWSWTSLVFILSVAAANIITTFLQCGWGPCAD
jgi:disulfide bond formation protein DsbB